MKSRLKVAAAIAALALGSCGTGGMANDVNKPIAQSEIQKQARWNEISQAVQSFAKRNNFAVQEQITEPRGMVDFNVRLFRDDITIMIGKIRNGPVEVTAYPLCACEMDKRFGLQAAADAAVADLTKELSAH